MQCPEYSKNKHVQHVFYGNKRGAAKEVNCNKNCRGCFKLQRISVRGSVFLSVCPSVQPSVCLSNRPFFRLFVRPSVLLGNLEQQISLFLNATMHVCKRLCPSVRLSVGRYVCPSVGPSIPTKCLKSYVPITTKFNMVCRFHLFPFQLLRFFRLQKLNSNKQKRKKA